jgi:hypothetical protein
VECDLVLLKKGELKVDGLLAMRAGKGIAAAGDRLQPDLPAGIMIHIDHFLGLDEEGTNLVVRMNVGGSLGTRRESLTERDPAAMTPELRRLMREASPELANSSFTTMEQVVEDSYGSQQLASRLLEIFGGIALILCIAGIYGLLAYLVTQRRRELGIRLALGAQRSRVMAIVLWQAGGMLLWGLGVGLMLAYMSVRGCCTRCSTE